MTEDTLNERWKRMMQHEYTAQLPVPAGMRSWKETREAMRAVVTATTPGSVAMACQLAGSDLDQRHEAHLRNMMDYLKDLYLEYSLDYQLQWRGGKLRHIVGGLDVYQGWIALDQPSLAWPVELYIDERIQGYSLILPGERSARLHLSHTNNAGPGIFPLSMIALHQAILQFTPHTSPSST